MTARGVFYATLALAGLSLYLWPALRAPVVMWTDSTTDLDWARRGVGVLTPAPAPAVSHPAKPFWILFLRAVTAAAPAESAPRAVVVVQSLLVWLAIGAAALFVGRRITPARGVLVYVVVLFGLLRLRDASSAVMSEALSAALLLVAAAALVDPPRRAAIAAALGALAGAIFLVRPNVGATAAALAALAWAISKRAKPALAFSAAFAVVVLPIWAATMPPPGASRGLANTLESASLDYSWLAAAGAPPSPTSPVDARHQGLWRIVHGLFGTEYYNARWSEPYRRMSELSRLSVPWLLVGALGILCAAPPNRASPARWLGLALVAMLVVQSYALGALPRYGLPMLPALFLFAVAAPPVGTPFGGPRLAIAATVSVLLVAAIAAQPQVVDWEWGLVESRNVKLDQLIPRGALPARAPATLHVRIGAPLLPTGAGVVVRGPDGATLYETLPGSERRRPDITVSLPSSLLERDRREPIVLRFEAVGFYDPTHYLLFPVVPPPWGSPARRDGSAELSPASGIAWGGLDWWAHEGEP